MKLSATRYRRVQEPQSGLKITAAFKSSSYLASKFCIIRCERETIISPRLRSARVEYFILYRMEF